MAFNCNICVGYQAQTFNVLLNHIGRCHSCDPNFNILCGVESCTRTYSNYRAFRNHIHKRHGDLLVNAHHDFLHSVYPQNYAQVDASSSDSDESDESDESDVILAANIKRANPHYLLKLKEENKMTQKCLDDIVACTTEIVKNSVNVIKAEIANALIDTTGMDYRDAGLEYIFADHNPVMNPFKGISDERSQLKFYKENFGLVEPVEIVLGHRHVKKRKKNSIKDVRINESVQYIPLLETLQQLLNEDSILEEIDNPHTRDDGLMADFCDGEVFKVHPLFSRDQNALQLILYFDELEVCNPLGTKTTKHKLGAFYFTLGNIKPQNRSHQCATFLLALVKSKVLKKYGVEAVLDPFMTDLGKLEQDAGYQFMVQGQPRNLRGSIAFFSADNLGAQYIGGFKEGSQAHRRCRECMSTELDISQYFHERHVTLRTVGGYTIQCQNIAGNDYYKKVYGINRYSPLNNSRFYHVIGGLPADCMHDILEGIFQYEVKELLKELIHNQQLFTLDELNKRINSFDYGYSNDANKPCIISEAKLASRDHNLKQKANQMWCLACFLPPMIGALVPEDNDQWQLFCKLLQITSILFSPIVSEDQVAYAQVLIEEHHNSFRALYPNSPITPKMHYMIHLPSTIMRLGPLVRSWCMRFEAKHNYFKQLAMSLGNYKNIPLTLGKRHQLWLCYQLQSHPGHLTTFISKGVEIGPGTDLFAGDVQYYDILHDDLPCTDRQTSITEVKWVKMCGTTYKKSCVICVGHDVFGDAQFAIIKQICVVDRDPNKIRFLLNNLHTLGWNSHFQSFEVDDQPDIHDYIFNQCDLVHYFLPLHMLTAHGLQMPGCKLIAPRYDIAEFPAN